MQKNTAKRVALLFCGGTMSSFRDPKTGGEHPIENKSELLEVMPELADLPLEIDVYTHILPKKFFLTTPDWEPIYTFITKKHEKYDGFVIVQESDTLIYGSCILGFLTSELSKPLIFTSSPTAIGSLYQETAKTNLRGALLCATSDLGEAVIFTNGKLIRAVRAKRQNIDERYTYSSSFIDDIGEIKNEKLHLNMHRIRRNERQCTLPYAYPKKHVFFVRYFPDFPGDCLRVLYERRSDALVIESLGYGSLPIPILEKLQSFQEVGTKIAVVAEYDSPTRTYPLDADETYRPYSNISLIKNMTVAATLVKTAFVLQNFPDSFSEKMNENFCGDIVQ